MPKCQGKNLSFTNEAVLRFHPSPLTLSRGKTEIKIYKWACYIWVCFKRRSPLELCLCGDGHLAQARLSFYVPPLPAFSVAALVAFLKSHQLKPAPSHGGFHYQDPESRKAIKTWKDIQNGNYWIQRKMWKLCSDPCSSFLFRSKVCKVFRFPFPIIIIM